MKKIKFEWEELSRSDDNFNLTARAKVIGGWIINSYTHSNDESGLCESMVFVPDPNHEWEFDND